MSRMPKKHKQKTAGIHKSYSFMEFFPKSSFLKILFTFRLKELKNEFAFRKKRKDEFARRPNCFVLNKTNFQKC